MQPAAGEIIQIDLDGSAWVACPSEMVPRPGQYLHAWHRAEPGAPLGEVLFPGGMQPPFELESRVGQAGVLAFRAAPGLPSSWGIGAPLALRGPLGQGFQLPREVRRLALVALGDTVERLLSLAAGVNLDTISIALFASLPLPALPMAVEAYPLSTLPEELSWPDFLALDLPVEALPGLRETIGLSPGADLACPAQALITLPMPCAAVGDCGACAVEGRFSTWLACKDGPVFDLHRLSR